MKWWEAPEWAKAQPMNFARADDGPRRVLKREPRYDLPGLRWVVDKTTVLTGPRRALQ